MKPTYEEFMAELSAELRGAEAVSRLLMEADRKYMQQTQEQMALCERVGQQLDSVGRKP